MDINIELYRTFYWIVKEKSITKAADKLYISQSAVTQSLKKLEEQLGGTLFIRNKKGVELTDAGEKLYQYIEASINVLNNAENMFSQYTNSDAGTIRISGGPAICGIFFADLIKKLSQKYPNINTVLTTTKTKEGMEKLLKNEIDMLVIEEIDEEECEGIETITISEFEFCFFTTPSYIEKIGGFKIEKANEYLYVTPCSDSRRWKDLEKKLKEKDININLKYEFSNGELLKKVVVNGNGIGYINELMIKDELKRGELVKLDFGFSKKKDKIVVKIRDSKKASNAMLKVVEVIEDTFGKK